MDYKDLVAGSIMGQTNKKTDPRHFGRNDTAYLKTTRRTKRASSKYIGWGAVAVVVVAIAAFIGIYLSNSGSSSSGTSSNGVVSGNDPALAPANVVNAVTNVPTAVFNEVGVGSSPPNPTFPEISYCVSINGLFSYPIFSKVLLDELGSVGKVNVVS
jgi:hypothetical protein